MTPPKHYYLDNCCCILASQSFNLIFTFNDREGLIILKLAAGHQHVVIQIRNCIEKTNKLVTLQGIVL